MREESLILFILFFVKNNLFPLLENDFYKVIVSFIYLFIFCQVKLSRKSFKKEEKLRQRKEILLSYW